MANGAHFTSESSDKKTSVSSSIVDSVAREQKKNQKRLAIQFKIDELRNKIGQASDTEKTDLYKELDVLKREL